MHCPQCGFEQTSDEIRFCKQCGLEISKVRELLAPELYKRKAKRKGEINKAQRQGFTMILFGLILVMTLSILRELLPVPKAVILASLLIFMVGGMIRMVSPYIFGASNSAEDENDSLEDDSNMTKLSDANFTAKILPEAEFRPPVTFGKQNYDTNELVTPLSVTEGTTRQLKKHLEQE